MPYASKVVEQNILKSIPELSENRKSLSTVLITFNFHTVTMAMRGRKNKSEENK